MFPRDTPIPERRKRTLNSLIDSLYRDFDGDVDFNLRNAIRNFSAKEVDRNLSGRMSPVTIQKLSDAGMSADSIERDVARIKRLRDMIPTLGSGKPKVGGEMRSLSSLRGGHVHKKSDDLFGDNSELAPYLTKYLRPSKYRQNVPPIESSSSESSDSEEGEPYRVMKGFGTSGKKNRKKIEDYEIIETQLHPDKAVLIEKKTRTKRIAGGKVIKSVKAAHEAAPSQDLWFI
jgi:hypothetical protein